MSMSAAAVAAEEDPFLSFESQHLPSYGGTTRGGSSSRARREIPLGCREDEEKLKNFDQILDHVGSFGPWQMLTLFLLWLPPLGGGVIVLLWSFAGLEPPPSFRYL